MKREIIYSFLLHGVIVTLSVLAPSLAINGQDDLGEVISVQVLAASDIYSAEISPPPAAAPAVQEETKPETPVRPPKPVETEVPIKTEPLPDEPKTGDESEPEEAQKENVPEVAIEAPVSGPGDSQSGGSSEIHSPTTAGGSPFAGATIDNASFTYPYWFTQAFNKILRNWKPRILSEGAVICVVYFQVIKSGRVIEVSVAESSGIPEFDQSCLTAVERAGPFPPLPRKFREEIIGITLPFKYDPSL